MWSSDSEDERNLIRQRRRRTFLPRRSMIFQSDHEFKERFRMLPHQFEIILQSVGHQLESPTSRNHSLSPAQKLKIALHWMGSGGQFHTVGDMHGVNKATVSRCVHQVVETINELLFDEKVCFPPNMPHTIEKFHAIAGMPRVMGCVDGTLIKIDAPSFDEPAFVDRHGDHSINCMAVCGPDLVFYYVDANWPGSVHDARVFRNSTLCERLSEGWRPFPGTFLLGDSGYASAEFMMTPLRDDPARPEINAFNRAHKSTRRVIECAFGVLKEKFPCLNHQRLNPRFAANVFKCSTVLCNMSKIEGEIEALEAVNEDDMPDEDIMEEEAELGNDGGAAVIQQLLRHFQGRNRR